MWWKASAAVVWLLLCSATFGQTPPFVETQSIATSAAGVPVQQSFSVPAAGTYQVTLTDLGAAETVPAPLASVAMAVTYAGAIVGTPLIGAGSLMFSAATAGTYQLQIVGVPGNTPGSGPIGIQVTGSTGVIFTGSANIALQSQPLPSSIGVLSNSFTIQNTDSYKVALSDLGFPQSLSGALTLILIQPGAALPTVILPDNGAMSATVQLNAGVTYDIFAIGQTGANQTAGLFSAVVTSASSGAIAFSQTEPVGGATLIGNAVVPAGSPASRTLVAADLGFPAALTQLGAVVVLYGQVVNGGLLSTSGSTSFAVNPGTYQVFGAAAPAAAAGAGSYAVQVQVPGGSPELAAAEAVTTPGGALSAYTFTATIDTGGAYTATLHDFQIPSALVSGRLAASQGTTLLGTPIAAPGSISMPTVAAGNLTLIAFLEGGQGGSLADVNVTDSGGELAFDQPQGVGAAFSAQQFSVTTPGNLTITATDLGFPAAFTDFAAIVTHGSQNVGSIYVSGTLAPIAAVPGNYFVNVIATPASSNASNPAAPVNSGTYSLKVSPSPASPLVMFSADETSVSSGGTAHLVWTTQDATSCTGSGSGWSGTFTGAQATSDEVTSPAITANATFTLTCTGPGGTTAQSVKIAVTSSSGGGGGGGALGLAMLLGLTACLIGSRFGHALRPGGGRARKHYSMFKQ